ncbi:glutathione S-transferase 1-like [Miscanthus floridulus]|uniref:glutathione S-transferase 1-like n=1 Tax=Miscanthus floridulus TaxID=154761 RepID=UPI003459B9FE
MAPMKLYGATVSWNVTRCVVALEEAGAEYQIVPIDFATAEHKSPDHLARNPFGQVPAFQDGDLHLWESRAIGKYVARKHKPDLLREGNLKESAMVDVWLEVEANQYTAALNPILYQCLVSPMFGGTTDQKVVEENLEKLKKVLEVYEARLAKHKYLAGDFLSLADLNHVSVTLCLLATPHASVFDAYPHVKAWWDGLMARPSVQKVAALMKPSA